MRLFAATREFSLLLRRSIAAARKYLKRKKKAPTRFYGKREHTTEGLSRRFFSDFFLIFVLPTKIINFFYKVLIDHTYKVYEELISNPKLFDDFLPNAFLLEFGGFI